VPVAVPAHEAVDKGVDEAVDEAVDEGVDEGVGLCNPLNFFSFCLRGARSVAKLRQAAEYTGTPPDEGQSE
jgi:hypothetical protein